MHSTALRSAPKGAPVWLLSQNPVQPEHRLRFGVGGLDVALPFLPIAPQKILHALRVTSLTRLNLAPFCSVVYKMCTQKAGNHTEEMYKRYQTSFQDYLVQTVLPAVKALSGEPMVSALWTSMSSALFVFRGNRCPLSHSANIKTLKT